MNKKRYILFCIILFQLPLSAQIIESKYLSDIYKYLDINAPKDTIIVIDIDNTLTKISPEIESWVRYKAAELVKKGLEKKEAFRLSLAMFFLLTSIIELLPIGDSPTIINDLQDKGFSVIALTNRSIPVVKRTIERLKKLHIDFSKHGFDINHDVDISDKYKGIFSHGIIFTGSNDKGEMLFLFFKKMNYTPKKIIFVDDRKINVGSVQKAAAEHKIPFVGIRLSLMDKAKEEFNPLKAEKIVHELQVKLGLVPIKKADKQDTQSKSWITCIWDVIIWPCKKIYDFFSSRLG